MAFERPITIAEAIEHVHRNEYVLPAIQREFVWSADQIVRLFDSLMRGYPIGSFLFWKVDAEHCKKYRFYSVLREFHERDKRHNDRIELAGEHEVTAVLDGQQRLTSLFIGLRGSYAWKLRHKRWSTDSAFPTRRLYLNLLTPARPNNEDGLRYDLRFLPEHEVKNTDEAHWFPVGKMLEFNDLMDIIDYLRDHDLLATKHPQNTLSALYSAIKRDGNINFYLETNQDLEHVLDIFIRVNSGGTKLSYSDLLLSMATAQWQGVDARQAITRLVDELNKKGDGFSFNKDFVLKSCLVLADVPDIGFKVSSFTDENLQRIEASWPRFARALRMTVDLAAQFGLSGHSLLATNALVPVAYYLLQRDLPHDYLDGQRWAADRKQVRLWLLRVLLRGIFGASTDTMLRAARTAIRDTPGDFPAEAINAQFARRNRSMRFEDEAIEELLDVNYGSRRAFAVLALLYPGMAFHHHLHQDHIFPRTLFHKNKLIAAGVPEARVDDFKALRDAVPNLQLLEQRPNQEKSARLPGAWLDAMDEDARTAFVARHHLPEVPATILDFPQFWAARRERLRGVLARVLGVQGGLTVAAETEA